MTGEKFTPAAKEAIYSLLARLADNKYALGRQYAEWCSGAPTLDSAVAAAAMAQDELGHARAIYPLLRTLDPKAGAENDPETRTNPLTLSFLRTPFTGWEDFVAANFLIDTAMSLIFEAAKDSAYEPLAGRSRKVLQEEQMHAMHGEAWVRRLAGLEGHGGPVRAALESALRRAWGEALCWLGPAGESGPLTGDHVLDATPDELRLRFLGVVGPTIEAESLALPVRRNTADGAWELTEPLPWSAWDSSAYRLRSNVDAGTGLGGHGKHARAPKETAQP